jgi:phosphatidylserine/phosphatidylglycerophosphate/cardiolipin synthase-like enzyme
MKKFISKIPIICLLLLFILPLFPLKSQGFNDLKNDDIQIFFASPLKTKKPINACTTEACLVLLNEINNAKESIDFAIYGIGNQDAIFNALINAKNRGVELRGVTDINEKGINIYKDTDALMQKLGTIKNDYVSMNDKTLETDLGFQTAIMHDKFFVFDHKTVWTGSANISSTDITGFNSNAILLIHSNSIADLYSREFEQMYAGKFHTLKTPISNNENILMPDNSVISVYFSPEHQAITTNIVPLINDAQKYVYIPAFFLTHRKLAKSLVEAHKRGVDVKIIVDAVSVQGKYPSHRYLRANAIAVKVENFAGKMHMKSIIIDDNILVIGSMNFTNQGESKNDENAVIIKNNSKMAVKYRKHFMQLWKAIPDKWLTTDPKPESPDSPGSCSDGIDNDFNGLTDNNDPNCNPNATLENNQPLKYFDGED